MTSTISGLARPPADAVLQPLGANYRVKPWLQLLAQINNLLDRRYYTAAQLGPAAFAASGNFIARPLPPVNGEFPVRQSTFFAPGAPARLWVGTRFKFNQACASDRRACRELIGARGTV